MTQKIMTDQPKRVTLEVVVMLAPDVEPLFVAEALFEFLTNDPDNRFPGIIEVEDFNASKEEV